MNRICIIAVYFGPFPACFGPWLTSCAYNPEIDFIIVSDQAVSDLPQNVKLIPFTLPQFKELADSKLGLNTALYRSYKCCDFKPVYGVILQDYIKQYAYWGHCDFDLVFGDLAGFFQQEQLECYDKFLPLGHLALYRNTEENMARYRLPADLEWDYRQVFTTDRNFAFDEYYGINRIFEYYQFPKYDKRIFADISIIYKRFRRALLDRNYRYQTFYWEQGKTCRAYYNGSEVAVEDLLYIHYKQRGFSAPDFELNDKRAFFITPKGFVEKTAGIPTLQDIRQTNPYPGALWEGVEHVAFRWKKRYRKLKKRIRFSTRRK